MYDYGLPDRYTLEGYKGIDFYTWNRRNRFLTSCRYGGLEYLTSCTQKNKKRYLDLGLKIALHYDQDEVAKYLISISKNTCSSSLYLACLEGNVSIINLLLEKGANNWNEGLIGACRNGSLELVKLMLSRGATNIERGFVVSCRTGRQHLIDFFIERGANNWTQRLYSLRFIQDQTIKYNLIKLMIEKGANVKNCDFLFDEHNFKIIKLFLESGCDLPKYDFGIYKVKDLTDDNISELVVLNKKYSKLEYIFEDLELKIKNYLEHKEKTLKILKMFLCKDIIEYCLESFL